MTVLRRPMDTSCCSSLESVRSMQPDPVTSFVDGSSLFAHPALFEAPGHETPLQTSLHPDNSRLPEYLLFPEDARMPYNTIPAAAAVLRP